MNDVPETPVNYAIGRIQAVAEGMARGGVPGEDVATALLSVSAGQLAATMKFYGFDESWLDGVLVKFREDVLVLHGNPKVLVCLDENGENVTTDRPN